MRKSAKITPSFENAKIAREPKLPCDAWRPGGLAKSGAADNSPGAILHVVLRPRYLGVDPLMKALVPLHLEQGCRAGFCSLQPCLPEIERMQALGGSPFEPRRKLRDLRRVRHLMKAISDLEPNCILTHTVIPAPMHGPRHCSPTGKFRSKDVMALRHRARRMMTVRAESFFGRKGC